MQYKLRGQLRRKCLSIFGWMTTLLLTAGTVSSLAAQDSGQKGENRILSVTVNQEQTVEIRTEIPVGYRYTAYDSYDPVRLVIDFPGMDVSAVKSPISFTTSSIQEIRASVFDLTSGKLGRIELLLSKETKYKISSNENLFTISFPELSAPSPGANKEAQSPAISAKPAEPSQAPVNQNPVKDTPSREVPEKALAAKTIKNVQISNGQAILSADGEVGRYQSFRLNAPSRLVVDVYGVKPGFGKRSYPASDGFRQLRVGTYEDKTRFVFDAKGETLPAHSVEKEGNLLVVSWGAAQKGTTARKGALPAVTPAEPKEKGASRLVSVEGVDFKVENGKSILVITLSAPAEVTKPKVEGKLVQFSIKNAGISQALRRTIDTSSFPSAVRIITPYPVSERGGKQEVRFAAELKGEVPYSMQKEGNKILFIVENKEFAQATPDRPEAVQIPLFVPAVAVVPTEPPPVGETKEKIEEIALAPSPAPVQMASDSGAGKQGSYSGEKISLVFDDANIRHILQLIGEVSNLNIIAGEEVKGSITLRLMDVPWDQALDLILQTKGLGMVRQGNVVQILPKEQIRALKQAEMAAAKDQRQLEQLVTEVIPVSYSSLSNVAAPAKDLLSERGKITEDTRNKQVIVTDIPSIVKEVRGLITILDTPERQVMIEARIVEANSTFSREMGIRWGLSYQNDDAGSGDLRNINVGGGGSFLLPVPAPGSVAPSAGLASGISFGRVLLDNTTLDLRISALESAGNGKVISTPRITTLNGGKALISQGTKIPYSTVSDKGTETKFENAELKLEVQPVINPDGSVILDIKASNSSVGAVVPSGGGTALSIEEKKAETKVIVQDGDTTVIGGIFVESDRYSQSGVPLLSRIPILGHLFKSTANSDERRELLVFITPRILQ